jgi:hypothetical protein
MKVETIRSTGREQGVTIMTSRFKGGRVYPPSGAHV